jgi:hypothetical protein
MAALAHPFAFFMDVASTPLASQVHAGVVMFTFGRPGWREVSTRFNAHYYNARAGVPDELASSAMAGSISGWESPEARPATEFALRHAS